MTRFGFNIRTKSGQRVDNIQIVAATLGDAERRLRQMYWQCQIVGVREQPVARRGDVLETERAVEMMSTSGSTHKSGTL